MIIDAYVRWTIITGNGRPQTLLASNHTVVMTDLVKIWRKLDVAILLEIVLVAKMVPPKTHQDQEIEDSKRRVLMLVLLVPLMVMMTTLIMMITLLAKIMMTNQITLVLVILLVLLVLMIPPLVMITILLVNTSQ